MEFTFFLKKFISLFIMPFSLGMLLLLFGIVLLYKNKRFKAKIALSLSFIWFFLISYSPLVNTLLYKFESVYPTLHTAPKDVKYIFVLGGGAHTDIKLPITSQVSETTSIRLNEAIRLYRQLNQNVDIVTSGFGGLHNPNSAAELQAKLAIALGVNKDHLLMQSTTKDTEEEAKAAKKLIGDQPFILVTSATHMKRAMKFFKQQGLDPIPAPTNHLAEISYPNYLDFFSARALLKSTLVWHEIIGSLWQKIKGI